MAETEIKLSLEDILKCKVMKNNQSYRLGIDRIDAQDHNLHKGDCVWIGIVKVIKNNGKEPKP